jgi:hypothetical protein
MVVVWWLETNRRGSTGDFWMVDAKRVQTFATSEKVGHGG